MRSCAGLTSRVIKDARIPRSAFAENVATLLQGFASVLNPAGLACVAADGVPPADAGGTPGKSATQSR